MEANLLDDKDINSENEAKNLEIENEDNIAIPTADSYSHVVTIARKH